MAHTKEARQWQCNVKPALKSQTNLPAPEKAVKQLPLKSSSLTGTRTTGKENLTSSRIPSSSSSILHKQAVTRQTKHTQSRLPGAPGAAATRQDKAKPPRTAFGSKLPAAPRAKIAATAPVSKVSQAIAHLPQPEPPDKIRESQVCTSPVRLSSYAARRLSGARKGQVDMDKLQSEYNALQQKLALLKRDPRDQMRPQQPTPSQSTLQSKQDLSSAQSDCLNTHDNLQAQCNIQDAALALQSLQFHGKYSNSELGQLATATFEEAEFVRLCEQGLTAQLQRTKEGATAQSRILELAGTSGWKRTWWVGICTVPTMSMTLFS